MNAKIKTIDIQAKEWFDKVNGNSYFSARITTNFGMKSEQKFVISMTYGYGEQYIYQACELLQKHGILPSFDMALTRYCRENGIILRATMHTNCLKRDVVNFTE